MKLETELKKWGNSLALRVTGVMAELPKLREGSKVIVEVSEEGFMVTPVKEEVLSPQLPYTEKELLADMTPHTSHADSLAIVSSKEYGE
jgi:antitoxin MazE